MRFPARAILIVASLVFAATANAQPKPGGGAPAPAPKPGAGAPAAAPTGDIIEKIQAEQIAKLFTDAGFQSSIIDNNKVHMVKTVFWTADTFSGAIPLVCEEDKSGCRAFEIFANLGKDSGVSQAWINAWNQKKSFVHVYKNPQDELIFAWDVALLTGVPPDYIKTVAQVFKLIVDTSSDFKP